MSPCPTQGKGDLPSIYLLIPPPMYDNNIYGPEFRPPGRAGGMQQDVYNQLLPKKLRKIAQQTKVGYFQRGKRRVCWDLEGDSQC